MDFEKKNSPVVKFTSILLMLAIITYLNLKIYQMNVKPHFLTEIYIRRSTWTKDKTSEFVDSINPYMA